MPIKAERQLPKPLPKYRSVLILFALAAQTKTAAAICCSHSTCKESALAGVCTNTPTDVHAHVQAGMCTKKHEHACMHARKWTQLCMHARVHACLCANECKSAQRRCAQMNPLVYNISVRLCTQRRGCADGCK